VEPLNEYGAELENWDFHKGEGHPVNFAIAQATKVGRNFTAGMSHGI